MTFEGRVVPERDVDVVDPNAFENGPQSEDRVTHLRFGHLLATTGPEPLEIVMDEARKSDCYLGIVVPIDGAPP